jgi:ABC-type phosphate transport system substrate-binding protein
MRRFAGLLFIIVTAGCLLRAASEGSRGTVGATSGKLATANQNLAIIVNLANPIEDVSKVELRKIFLAERTYWPNGRRITLVMRAPGDPERKSVLREICQMNEEEFKNHFLHGLFTGEILVSPKILATPAGVRKFVFNVPGAIGFLRAEDVDATVKVISIDELLPGDKGYTLRLESRSDKQHEQEK